MRSRHGGSAFTTTVFVDIGDDQSIEKSLSTFSSRIVRLKRILERSSDRSLVLIDEIGDGTDPEEGAALAEAALERLIRSCGRVIVTTHLKSLKGWAHGAPGARNATLEFDPDRLEPLFVLRMGVPGRSWGIEMAGRLGPPAGRSSSGRWRASRASRSGSRSCSRTSKRPSASSSRERKELVEKERLLSELIESYRDRLDRFKEDRDDLDREGPLGGARYRYFDAAGHGEAHPRDQDDAGRPAARSARRTRASRKSARSFEKKLPGEKERAASPPRGAPPGHVGRDRESRQGGRIVSIDASRAFLELDGGLRVETDVRDLSALERGRNASAARGRSRGPWRRARPSPSEISVRGLEKAEALERVDAFLDRAVLQGLRTVTVIHGIGKGILKRALYDVLRKDPRVASVRPGEPAHGGDGVAIVDLR